MRMAIFVFGAMAVGGRLQRTEVNPPLLARETVPVNLPWPSGVRDNWPLETPPMTPSLIMDQFDREQSFEKSKSTGLLDTIMRLKNRARM